ncbi:hypothetical protein TNCT_32201 [Trichonephila clavata]|uniref:Uncharacterized protein n=1 Tax=Trichonephila clavata TaxID=2740835 RepID=A0A8X6HUJ3_TRICU|nr:hypothetical protein TNCT_32201 [Trichonephila clavata]
MKYIPVSELYWNSCPHMQSEWCMVHSSSQTISLTEKEFFIKDNWIFFWVRKMHEDYPVSELYWYNCPHMQSEWCMVHSSSQTITNRGIIFQKRIGSFPEKKNEVHPVSELYWKSCLICNQSGAWFIHHHRLLQYIKEFS